MTSKNIFLVFSGLGLGNTTRILALVEELRENDPTLNIHLFTWGVPHSILLEEKSSNKQHIHKLIPYGRSFFFLGNIPVYFLNTILLLKHRLKVKPSLVLMDSDYHFAAFLFRSFPLVFLGQALDVMERAKQFHYKSGSVRKSLTFFIREKLDFFIQSLFCDHLIVPSFLPKSKKGKVNRVPLIVRRDFLLAAKAEKIQSTGIAFVSSGSGLDEKSFASLAKELGIQPSEKRMKLISADSLFEKEAVLCRGGLSSISECIAMSKFCISHPIKNNPEQEINAITLETLGMGIHIGALEKNTRDKIVQGMDIYHNKRRVNVETNGAEVSTQLILSIMGQNIASS